MTTTRYPSDFTGTPNTDYLEIKMIRRNYAGATGNEYKMEDPGNGLPNTLILNMPQKVTESISQNWATAKLGEIGPYLGKRGPSGQSPTGVDGLNNTVKRLIENFLLKGAVENFSKLGASNLNENGILSSTSGVVYNPNLEVLYDGPDFRRFNFQFSLFTKSDKDAAAIYNIVRFFQIASVPSASGDNIRVSNEASAVLVDSAAVTAAEGIAQTAQSGFNQAASNFKDRVFPTSQPSNTNQPQQPTSPGAAAGQAGIDALTKTVGGYLGSLAAQGVFTSGVENRFIKQPPFLLLTYKRGADFHPFIRPLMPCSLDSLNIDYTPTGNYTVMDNFGEPSVSTVVGVNITIQLTEVKALFREDYDSNFANRAKF